MNLVWRIVGNYEVGRKEHHLDVLADLTDEFRVTTVYLLGRNIVDTEFDEI